MCNSNSNDLGARKNSHCSVRYCTSPNEGPTQRLSSSRNKSYINREYTITFSTKKQFALAFISLHIHHVFENASRRDGDRAAQFQALGRARKQREGSRRHVDQFWIGRLGRYLFVGLERRNPWTRWCEFWMCCFFAGIDGIHVIFSFRCTSILDGSGMTNSQNRFCFSLLSTHIPFFFADTTRQPILSIANPLHQRLSFGPSHFEIHLENQHDLRGLQNR